MSALPIPPRPDGSHGAPIPPPPPTSGRPQATWRWWEAVGVYLIAILLAGFATLPVIQVIRSEGLATLVGSAVSAIVIVGVLVLWLNRSHPSWRGAIGFPRSVWAEVWAGLGFGALLYPVVVFGAGLVLTLVLETVTGGSISTPRQVPAHLSAAGVSTAIAYGVVIAPIHEELFFRGILFRGIRDRYGFVVGGLGSAAAFGLIHYLPGPWAGTTLLIGVMMFTGFALAWFYERRGNIVANMVAHATFNVIGLVLIFMIR